MDRSMDQIRQDDRSREEAQRLLQALSALRCPVGRGEYDLHAMIARQLEEAGIPFRHEVSLGSRCRIDFLCGGVGIEVKKGRPDKTRLQQQLLRYSASPEIHVLIAVTEGRADLPVSIGGKPVYGLCLSRLWGIALP